LFAEFVVPSIFILVRHLPKGSFQGHVLLDKWREADAAE